MAVPRGISCVRRQAEDAAFAGGRCREEGDRRFALFGRELRVPDLHHDAPAGRACRPDDCGDLRGGDVVWMPVAAEVVVGGDHVWASAANETDERLGRRIEIGGDVLMERTRIGVPLGAVHAGVAVAEQVQLVVPDGRDARLEFGEAHGVQVLAHLGRVHRRVEDVTLLPAGAAHQHRPGTLGLVAGDTKPQQGRMMALFTDLDIKEREERLSLTREILDKPEAHPIWRERASHKGSAAGMLVGTGIACCTKDYGTGADCSLGRVT